MKHLFLGLLLAVSTQSFAKQCLHGDEVSKVCLSKAPVSATITNFLKLEKEIAVDGEINYLEQFKVYSGEGVYGQFSHYHSTEEALTALSKWATKELAVYDTPEYNAFDMMKHSKEMDKKAFTEFLEDSLMDLKTHMQDIANGDTDDFKPAMKKKVAQYKAKREAAKKAMINLVFAKNVKEIVVYSLLDNNDSNVADAQYVIVADDKVILVNRYWWL